MALRRISFQIPNATFGDFWKGVTPKGWSRKAQASVAFCVLKFISQSILQLWKKHRALSYSKRIELGFLEVRCLAKTFPTYKSHLSFVVDGKKRKLTYTALPSSFWSCGFL